MAVMIGQTSAGAAATFTTQGSAVGFKFLADETGDVETLHIISGISNDSMADLHLAIYSDDDGFSPSRPGTLLGYGTATGTPSPATEVQVTLDSPVAVVSGTAYHLVLLPEGGSAGYDWQGTNANVSISGGPLTQPAGTWTHTTNFTDATPAIWGEGTIGGGGGDTSTIMVKVSGAFVEKPLKARVSGAWFPA